MKERCAKEALKYIKNNSVVGLGGGSTISYLVKFIKEAGMNVKIVTPSFQTEQLSIENGLNVVPLWSVNHVDIAFDGCDEVDLKLNALKSGGAIHTKEKIIGKMADEYILLVDESKVSEKLTFKYPVVLEIFKESIGYVSKKIMELGGNPVLRKSSEKDGFVVSDNGLVIMDVFFKENSVENIQKLHDEIMEITGVVDISLFCNVATKVICVTENGFKNF